LYAAIVLDGSVPGLPGNVAIAWVKPVPPVPADVVKLLNWRAVELEADVARLGVGAADASEATKSSAEAYLIYIIMIRKGFSCKERGLSIDRSVKVE